MRDNKIQAVPTHPHSLRIIYELKYRYHYIYFISIYSGKAMKIYKPFAHHVPERINLFLTIARYSRNALIPESLTENARWQARAARSGPRPTCVSEHRYGVARNGVALLAMRTEAQKTRGGPAASRAFSVRLPEDACWAVAVDAAVSAGIPPAPRGERERSRPSTQEHAHRKPARWKYPGLLLARATSPV